MINFLDKHNECSLKHHEWVMGKKPNGWSWKSNFIRSIKTRRVIKNVTIVLEYLYPTNLGQLWKQGEGSESNILNNVFHI